MYVAEETIRRQTEKKAEEQNDISNLRNKFIEDMNKDGSELHRTINANGYFTLSDMKFNDSFYRFPRNDPYNYVDGAREYLFFTKPDLPLMNGSGSFELAPFAKDIPYFNDLADSPGYQKSVFQNLSYRGAQEVGDTCPFIRILSNRKTSNMDVPDIQVEELETAVNMYGSKILYPKSSQSGDENVDFNVEFEDTRYLEIYHLFKVWDYFRCLRWYGLLSPAFYLPEFGPNRTDINVVDRLENMFLNQFSESSQSFSSSLAAHYAQYIYYKILYDHIRVFKFLVDHDGETILYAASAIGCFPKTIQRSTFSEIADKGPLKISIGFKVSGWFEDEITNVVQDFNAIICEWQHTTLKSLKERIMPIYDYEIGMVSQELVDIPFILATGPVKDGTNNPGRATDFKTYNLFWAKA